MSESIRNKEEVDYTEKIQEAILNFENLKKDHVEEIASTPQAKENNKLSKKLNPFENVKFSGQNDTQHPKGFIGTFEKIAVEVNLNESEKQYYFIESLVADAGIWLKNRRFGTYEEMKTDFLNFYWSPNKQQSFLDHLDVGKYDKNCELSMTEYFLKYFNGAQFLEKTFSNEELISDLLQHFDFNEEVETAFQLQSVKTLEEALDVLKKVEAPIHKKSRKSESYKKHKNKFSFIPDLDRIRRGELTFPVIILTFVFALYVECIIIKIFFPDDISAGDNQAIANIINEYNNTYTDIPHFQKFNPFETLKFSGRPNSIHPKSFIQNFEHITAEENLDLNAKKYYFIQSLVEDAQDWLNVRGYGTYEEMKEALLEFYWSPEIQKSFLDYLIDGKYDEESGLSLNRYFFKYVNEAKFLENAPSEEKVISHLLNHFHFKLKIRIALKVRPVKTLEEALDILANAETLDNSFFYKYRVNIMIGLSAALCVIIAEYVVLTLANIQVFNYFFDICLKTVITLGIINISLTAIFITSVF